MKATSHVLRQLLDDLRLPAGTKPEPDKTRTQVFGPVTPRLRPPLDRLGRP